MKITGQRLAAPCTALACGVMNTGDSFSGIAVASCPRRPTLRSTNRGGLTPRQIALNYLRALMATINQLSISSSPPTGVIIAKRAMSVSTSA